MIITGPPKIGKSTILEKTIATLTKNHKSVLGCVVKEIKHHNTRIGFDLCFLPKQDTVLLASSQQELSGRQIGRFYVSISTIDNTLIPYMHTMSTDKTHDVLVFDEIGRMQNLSPKFLAAVDKIMGSQKPLITTIVYDYEKWAQKYKDNSKHFIIDVNESNRDFIPILINSIILSADYITILNDCYISNILQLFNRLLKNNKQEELLKLFKRTVKYLAHNNTRHYTQHICSIQGETALRTVTYDNNVYRCTCQFHKQDRKECSHIQTFSIIKACEATRGSIDTVTTF